MPVKHPSPLLGYNNNVRHKGKVFHVQTEDSGVKYGHIITHLFMDGGRILKSVKTSYSEYVDNDRMGEIVREMMKQQHKAMFIALRDGKFDPIIDGADSPSTQAFPAASPAAPPAEAADRVPALAPLATAAVSRASGAAVRSPTPAPPPVVEPEEDAPQTLRQSSEELSLDIDAVERAAAAASPISPAVRAAADLPPPPANLFRDKPVAGKYRVASPPSAPRVGGPGPVAARPPSSSQIPATRVARGPSGGERSERRYAPTRPASIFGQARPQQGKSIFGEDLISDKSLDEVILSYLAEDLDEKK
jgi:hypothetical protein